MWSSTNVTVQWSIMADSLYSDQQRPGIGSLLRLGSGALSFHHNLYADNYTASPRLGDNLTLDFVNNVIYNWGRFSGLSGGTNDLGFSPNGCTNQLNYVCNYLIAGPDTAPDRDELRHYQHRLSLAAEPTRWPPTGFSRPTTSLTATPTAS